MKKIAISLFTAIIMSCASPQNLINSLTKTAYEKFGEKYYLSYNKDSSFVICINKKPSEVPSTIVFFIYDLKKSKIIFDDSKPKGFVKWIDNSKVHVNWIPGIVKGDESKNSPTEYIFDVIMKKKISSLNR